MNIVRLLKPKAEVAYLKEKSTLKQALKKMKHHGYSAIPVIDEKGEYVGTISEGDFLWHILDREDDLLQDREKTTVSEIIRRGFNPAVTIDTAMEDLLTRVTDSNFVPVVDDRNIFMGIITRQDVIKYFRTVKIFNENLFLSLTTRV